MEEARALRLMEKVGRIWGSAVISQVGEASDESICKVAGSGARDANARRNE